MGGHVLGWRTRRAESGSRAVLLMLFGWLPADAGDTPDVLAAMAAALRVTAEERATVWTLGALGIGLLERPFGDDESGREPARVPDGSALWMSGEAFDWPSHGGIRRASESRSLAFRTRLLAAVAAEGAGAIRDLDGEYQIAFWNAPERRLLLLNDRFGALPMYLAARPRGIAFAGGVRGVAPVSAVRRRLARTADAADSRDRRLDGSRRSDAHRAARHDAGRVRRAPERLHRRRRRRLDALLRESSRRPPLHDAVLRRRARDAIR